MNAAIAAVLSVLQLVLPLITDSTKVGGIIDALTKIIPLLIKEVDDLVPMVKNIITALKGNPATTVEQIDQLKTLDQQTDDAFEAALAKAEADDAAANQEPPVGPPTS